ncbi:hypothetical protein GGI24_006974 [Coemansia furcata]|nr:hypothetical protein GGI24_006974 [Coemansia furcata]
MQTFTLAIAVSAVAGIALANKPVAPAYGTPYAPAPVNQYAAPAPIAYAAPVTVVQNAASVEPTVTVTHINGASSKALSLGAAAVGALAFAYI